MNSQTSTSAPEPTRQSPISTSNQMGSSASMSQAAETVQKQSNPPPEMDVHMSSTTAVPLANQTSSEMETDAMAADDSRAGTPLDINHALKYLDAVKAKFEDKPSTYSRFLDVMREFKSHLIDTPAVIARVAELFHGHPELIEGFNTFLPHGYKIECSIESGQQDVIRVTTPSGKVFEGTSSNILGSAGFNPNGHVLPDTTNLILPPPPTLTPHISSTVTSPQPLQSNDSGGSLEGQQTEPINHAIDFVNRIKQRYADEPQIYRRFLDVLQSYQKGGSRLQEVHNEVTALFQQRAPDLYNEFRNFLPNVNEDPLMGMAKLGGGSAFAKTELGVEAEKEYKERAGRTPDGKGKRKRKVPEKDFKERELPPKASSSSAKSKKPKHHHPEHLSPAMQPRTYIQSDEHIFFDRVRRYFDSRETYDEFLKLLNYFSQDMIDGRTLLENAMSFLGDTDLMVKFREIVGLEGKDPFPEKSVANVRVGLDRNMKALSATGYKSAYKKLPITSEPAPCSGRDELCKSVLNDEYVLAPDINPDDGGFVGHKKNVYEEALHRTEEERHEYDFYLEAISRTINMLEPINTKILQIPTVDERHTFKLKPNLGGVLKSIHQRVLKKIYGREAGMEVVQAMQDIPATAIPVVLQRLRQKEEEWRRSQREWNKIWREVDKRNYYKSLDHQGITFKNNDKKMITGKFFIAQIEAARDAELFMKASMVDSSFRRTRPNHQLEYTIESIPVLQDTIKLCLSYLDRVQGQYHSHERKKIEEFIRTFPPMLLGLDHAEFEAGLAAPPEGADGDTMSVDECTSIGDEADEASGRAARSRRGLNGPASTEKDLRKKLLKSEQAKSSRNRNDGARSPRSVSRHQSPARADGTQTDHANPYGTRLANGRNGKTARSSVRNPIFFCNSTVYVFYRQLLLLYSRLHTCKELSIAATVQQSSGGGHELRLGESPPPGLDDKPNPAAHFYTYLLHTFEQLFDNEIEQNTFEDILRYMFGTKAYHLFTVDKLIAALLKQILAILTEPKSQDICGLFLRERENPAMGTYEATELYRQTVVKQLEVDENVYRVDFVTDSSLVTFRLLGKDDIIIDDTELLNEQWRAYLDSYTTNEFTDGIQRELLKQPYLTRNMPPSTPSTLPPTFFGLSQLEIRVCTRSYRLFYVPGTSESFHNRHTDLELKNGMERFKKGAAAQGAWLQGYNKGGSPLSNRTVPEQKRGPSV